MILARALAQFIFAFRHTCICGLLIVDHHFIERAFSRAVRIFPETRSHEFSRGWFDAHIFTIFNSEYVNDTGARAGAVFVSISRASGRVGCSATDGMMDEPLSVPSPSLFHVQSSHLAFPMLGDT